MLSGLAPVRNVLGVSDPDVHHLDGRWVMFLGGFTTRFRVSLFAAELPPGAPLSSVDWRLVTEPSRPHRARPLVPDPPSGAWDSKGMHTPSYVRGIDASGNAEERIYYAGRSSRSITGPQSRYSIGCLRRMAMGWQRLGEPVHVGVSARPSVLEPLVRYEDGRWRMWYLSAIGEVGRHYEMVVARGTNLYSTANFPAQGLWWLRADSPSGRRQDWTDEPVRLLDTEVDPLPWFANGGCGPSFHYGDTQDDRQTMYVFFTGTRPKVNWWRYAARRLQRLRLPPVPTPYHLAVGRIAVDAPVRTNAIL